MASESRALEAFVGDWAAEGTTYSADRESGPWHSVHSARWHSGGFFVVQDEHANGPFDTLSFLGWDPDRNTYFSWSIENHGFAREYLVTVDGHVWTFSGKQERATVTFTDNGRTQTHHWEVRPKTDWTPLCDRVATRVD